MLLYRNCSFIIKMAFVKQPIDIPVVNMDERTSLNDSAAKTIRHSDLLPNHLRCIIAGPSGCGKTNVLISLIESEHGLKFENLYLYSKTLEQPKYRWLCEMLRPIRKIGCFTFPEIVKPHNPKLMRPNSLIVFDDVITERGINKTVVRDIFTLGRHRNLDVVYIVQTYTKLDKHLIRDNSNFVILFRQDELNLRHVYQDFSVNADMKFEQFREICNDCWREPFGFMCISLEHEVSAGRYRKNFNEYLQQQDSNFEPESSQTHI